MADIVSSLFGVTPELYQQAQAAQADKAAADFAQMKPFEKASFGIGRGAYQLAGALGGEDPQLKLISARNAIARQINYNDPASIQQGVQQLAQAGDTVGAMQLATVGRDLEYKQAQTKQALAAAGRERQQATPEKIQLAREFALQKGEPGSPEYIAEYNAQLARLTTTERPEAMTPEMRNAAALASLKGAPGSPEYQAEYTAQLARLTTKETRDDRFGVDREAVSLELYNKPFAQLTTAERATVNTRVESEQNKKAKSSAPQFVLPGDTKLADIPAFRASVQRTIAPQLEIIGNTRQAEAAIDDSLATGNFASFRAAQTQFAKAIAGAGDLSQRELKAAGADPSMLGGFQDYVSTLFTSTPSKDSQMKIKAAIRVLQNVARQRATAEIGVQQDIALASPGYNAEAVKRALNFPELALPAPAAQAPIYARNPNTKERIMSTDGGATWAPAPAASSAR